MSNEEILQLFSDQDKVKIILSSLALPIDQAQLIIPGLEQFTLFDIKNAFSYLLKHPPLYKHKQNKLPYEEPFTLAEDMVLLQFIRFSKDMELADFIENFGSEIKPYRTIKSINKRINELKKMDKSEKTKIIDSITDLIMQEESFYMSTNTTEEMKKDDVDTVNFLQTRNSYHPEISREPSKHIDYEIDKLMKVGKYLTDSSIPGDECQVEELASLRGENVMFSIRREAVLLGRATSYAEVDIDLTVESDKNSIHIDRKQAILSFLPDCNFYIENIGNRPFRVNGVVIKSGKMCRVPPFAILDFSNVLFMFVPNERFIQSIRENIQNTSDGSKKE